MMVVTRGQTGSDGRVTPTANQAAPARSNPSVAIPPEDVESAMPLLTL